MTIDLEVLNANQRAAVEWSAGPLLVLAGPGSGKTKVLTVRIAKLIEDSPGQRFRILGLTFTTKAAAEMRDRVDAMVPEARDRTLLSTFHSYCASILRQHGSHLGLSPDFVILNQEADREAVLADAIKQVQEDGAEALRTDTRLLPLIDRLLDQCVPQDEVESRFRDKEVGRKLAALYKAYRNLLISQNRLDFPSLLNCVTDLLKAKPEIARHVHTVYKHICVDEFQDTNLAQYRVLEAIVGDEPRNLFVVADDDQIIYEWNGASYERLRQLEADYNMHVIQLPANYRCPPAVIELANNLIEHNHDRSPGKQPISAVKMVTGEDVIRLKGFETFADELDWIASDIERRPLQERAGCVILARAKKLLDRAVGALTSRGLPASLAIRKDEFTSTPFGWLHAVLRLANARADREQLRWLCKAFYELEGVDVEVQEVAAKSTLVGGDHLRSWFDIVLSNSQIETHTKRFLTSGSGLLVDRMDFLGFITLAFKWFEEVNQILAGQDPEGFVDYDQEKAIWHELQDHVLKEYGKEDLSLNVLLQEFDLSPKTPPIPTGAVRCLTIHTAKGMEFEHVYLIGLAEDQLPSFQSIKKGDRSREMEEERRNCFVAITRTQESLTLTYSREYFGWDKRPSRFLQDMQLVK